MDQHWLDIASTVFSGALAFHTQYLTSYFSGPQVLVEFPMKGLSTGPSALVLGPDGRMYGTGEPVGANNIFAIDVNGNYQIYGPIPTPNAGPGGIAFSANGDAWFTCNRSNKLCRLVLATGVITEFAWNRISAGLGGITRRTDGKFWICETGAPSAMAIYDPVALSIGSKFSVDTFPHDPLIDLNGNCYFSCFSGTKMGIITNAGVYSSFSMGAGSKPYANCQRPDGIYFITDQGNHKLLMLDAVNNILTPFSPPTALSNPSGICYNPLDGNIWAMLKNANKFCRLIPTDPVPIKEFSLGISGSAPVKVLLGADGRNWYAGQSGNNMGAFSVGA